MGSSSPDLGRVAAGAEAVPGEPALPRRLLSARRLWAWFLGSTLLHCAVAALAFRTPRPVSAGRDGHHYVAIAMRGYDQLNVVFPPLYPALIRIGSFLGRPDWAAFVVSIVAAGVATVLFGILLVREQPVLGGTAPDDVSARLREADWGVVFFTVGSYAWLHMASTPSSEPVAMALMLAAILLFDDGRSSWGALVLAAASLTRTTFFLLGPYFAYVAWRRRRRLLDAGWSAAALVGLGVQHALVYQVYGRFVTVSSIQAASWGSSLLYPFAVYGDLGGNHYRAAVIARVTVMLVAYVAALALLRRTRWLWQGAPMLLFLVSLNAYAFFGYGFERQAIPILAPFLALVQVTRARPGWRLPLAAALAVISIASAAYLIAWQGYRPRI